MPTKKTDRVLAFDCDSVLFPINELVVLPALRAAGYEIEKEDITSWDYPTPAIKTLAYKQFRRPDLYDGRFLGYEERQVLAALRDQGHELIAVSSPFPDHARSKWRYLQRCGFYREEIVLTGDKRRVRFDLLIDDSPDVCLGLGPERCMVFDQPWNRGEGLAAFDRLYGWTDAVTHKIGEKLKRG